MGFLDKPPLNPSIYKFAFSTTALFNLEAWGKETVETLYPSIIAKIYNIIPFSK